MAKKARKNHVVKLHNTSINSTSNNRTKFTLYNFAGKEKAYYLVDRVTLERSRSDIREKSVVPAREEPLASDYTYQLLLCKSAKKINGTSGTLKICGLKPEDEVIIYKYKPITALVYEQLNVCVAQNDESVYAFASSNLAEGNLNTAKYAIASTFNTTLTERHAKALTNQQVAELAQDIDIALFYPNVLQEHEILDRVKVNERISLLELLKIFEEHRNSIIINLRHLQENYQRKGIKRVQGSRDENGGLFKPSLTTQYMDKSEYVGMGLFEINHNTATINMLTTRKARLLKAEGKTSMIEVAGLLVNDLATFNNYTIVSDGEVNVKSLQVKISSKKAFSLLKEKGVLEPAQEFDFCTEYTIKLENLPLVPFDRHYSSIDGLFYQLAEIKVISSIISSHLRAESDAFVPEQLEELKKHYLSKSLYINFPTTNEYTDIKEALANGTLDSRVSYKIDIGSKDILNLRKVYSANKFFDRMYQAYDTHTGDIFLKSTLDMALVPQIAFKHKQLSSRTRITKVDDFMKPIFDDFLGLEKHGIVEAILVKVGAESLLRVLQNKWNGKAVSKEEMLTALTTANTKLEEYVERIYLDNICPLVFYIGSTGLLPDEMKAKAITFDQLAVKYPNLQFSRNEQEGMFFEVGESIISVYAKSEYYTNSRWGVGR